MSTVNVLVIDSHHTEQIVNVIQGALGEKAKVYGDICPPKKKIDVFFLSGLKISVGGVEYVRHLKKVHGSGRVKVVAVSVDQGILAEVGRPEFEVDFTISKKKLIEALFLADDGVDTRSLEEILQEIMKSL